MILPDNLRIQAIFDLILRVKNGVQNRGIKQASIFSVSNLKIFDIFWSQDFSPSPNLTFIFVLHFRKQIPLSFINEIYSIFRQLFPFISGSHNSSYLQ